MAFLLALALVVSVMSGLGLSVSAEQESNTPGTEEVQQQDKTEAGAAPSEVKAEEEAAKPEEKPVQEEKADEQKKQEATKTDDAAKDDANAQDGNQKDEPQAEPAAEEPAEPVGEVANKQTLPVANAPRATMRNDIVVPEPSYKKKAEYNAQNDAYDLSLSVSGNVSSQTERSMVDILLILDKSNSMSGDRWTNTRNAAHNLINALDENKNLNVRYNVVTFYGAGTGVPTKEAKSQTNGWTSSANGAKNSIESEISSGRKDGGTNYQAGIRLGIQQLQQARDGAQTVVVFLSDGAPTFRLTPRDQNELVGWDLFGRPQYENYEYGNGKNDDNEYNIEEAVSEIGGMHVSQFYAIGLGNNFKTNLTKLNNAVDAAVKADDVYTTENSSGLEAIFKAIAGKINNIACKDVKITDTINTQYAQVVTQTNGNPTKLTITVKKADGTVVESGENSITLDATELNKEPSVLNASYQKNQLVLDFPDKYQLEDGWTYTITTQVKPTQAAYEYYSDHNGSYPNSGDANTGTHSGEPGFWSNTSAVLDYTVSGTGKHATYAQPVIQVKAGTLKITKNISGLTPEQIDAMKGDMTFTINKNDDAYKTIHLSDFVLKDKTYTYEMPYCVPGATYTVTESNMAVEGFDCATKVNNTDGASDSATIEKGKTETIAFTNDYTLSAKNLTIEKKVDGQKPENLSAEFSFKIEGPKNANGDYTITGKTEKVTFTNGEANITINGESSITIEKLPLGTYKVTETSMGNVDHYTWTTSENAKTGETTLSAGQDGTVTITNILKKNPKVTVKKEVTGNMYQESDKFNFTTGVTGYGSFDLSADDEGKVIEIPYNSDITVTESANDKGYTLAEIKINGKKVNASGRGYELKNVTSDTTITFVNDKTIQPPNGIITTIAPYAIMVVLAAGAGVYFVYSRRRRNH